MEWNGMEWNGFVLCCAVLCCVVLCCYVILDNSIIYRLCHHSLLWHAHRCFGLVVDMNKM